MCRARSAARRTHTRAALNACMFSSVMGVALARSTRPRGASLAPSSRLRHVRHAQVFVFNTFTSASGTRTRVSDTFRRELRIVEHARACPRYDTRLVANTAAPSCPNQSHSRTLYASFTDTRAIFSTSSAKFSTSEVQNSIPARPGATHRCSRARGGRWPHQPGLAWRTYHSLKGSGKGGMRGEPGDQTRSGKRSDASQSVRRAKNGVRRTQQRVGHTHAPELEEHVLWTPPCEHLRRAAHRRGLPALDVHLEKENRALYLRGRASTKFSTGASRGAALGARGTSSSSVALSTHSPPPVTFPTGAPALVSDTFARGHRRARVRHTFCALASRILLHPQAAPVPVQVPDAEPLADA